MITLIAGVIAFTGMVLVLVFALLAVKAAIYHGSQVVIHLVHSNLEPFSADRGGTLLNALHDHGVHVPAGCGGKAICGECKVRVLQGGGVLLDSETPFINKKKARQHYRLACQVKLKQDLEVHLPDAINSVEKFACNAVEVRQVASFMREITLQLPRDKRFCFEAGQYLQVYCPAYELDYSSILVEPTYQKRWQENDLFSLRVCNHQATTRSYSLASNPGEQSRVKIIVRLATPPKGQSSIPPGIVSSYLFGLHVGDSVVISGPYGAMTVGSDHKDIVLIGGGAGMAPLFSMIEDQLINQQTKRAIQFFYGARSLNEVFYSDALDQLQKQYPNFRWQLVLSKPQPEDCWQGATGLIHQSALKQLETMSAPEDCKYYLCGPPPMIDACVAMLDELGVDADDIQFDKFG